MNFGKGNYATTLRVTLPTISSTKSKYLSLLENDMEWKFPFAGAKTLKWKLSNFWQPISGKSFGNDDRSLQRIVPESLSMISLVKEPFLIQLDPHFEG
jgi:hypothetical protein